MLVAEHGDNQEKAVGIVRASLPDLPGIKNKIFAKHRELSRFARVTKIFERATEKFAFGKNRERACAVSFQGSSESDGIKRIANHAARWRCRLEFGNDVDTGFAQGGGKIAQRSRGLDAIPQRSLGKNFFAMFDFEQASFQNLVEHRSGGWRRFHESEIVC